MRPRFIALTALLVSLFLTTSARAELKIGDPAPAIKVSKFVKNGPLNSFESGKVYVMEFWATWCGPCIQAIPHLTELQKKYREQGVVFMGTSVWENEADQSKVEPFVQKMGDKMDYIVAMDDRSDGGTGVMAETWLAAAGQNGIPASFVVDQKGRIAWIGHPMQLEEVLKEVLAGTFDVEKQSKMANAMKELESAANEAAKNQDWNKLVSILDEYSAKYPALAPDLMMSKFQLQLMQMRDAKAAYATAEAIIKTDNAMNINGVAWIIATTPDIEPRDLDLAMRAAQKAVEMTNSSDPTVIDTLARIHFIKGDVDQAIELETKAVEMSSGPIKDELQKSLDEFMAAKK